MKYNLKIILLVLMLLSTLFAFSQEKKDHIDLVLGGSIPELYHCGIRYHYRPNARIDLNLGSDFNNNENGRLYALTLNHAYYIGKINSKVNEKLWSVNTGINLLIEDKTYRRNTDGSINFYFAREFPITKRIFIQPELGATYFLFEHSTDVDYYSSGYRIRLIPKFGINVILKI